MTKLSAKLPKFMFIREAYAEMKHVTWPKTKHVGIFTTLVIVCVIVFSYFISFVDRGFLFGLGELRTWLNPDAVNVQNSTTQFQTTPGTILDSNGNEIQIDKVLTQDELNNVDQGAVQLNTQ